MLRRFLQLVVLLVVLVSASLVWAAPSHHHPSPSAFEKNDSDHHCPLSPHSHLGNPCPHNHGGNRLGLGFHIGPECGGSPFGTPVSAQADPGGKPGVSVDTLSFKPVARSFSFSASEPDYRSLSSRTLDHPPKSL